MPNFLFFIKNQKVQVRDTINSIKTTFLSLYPNLSPKESLRLSSCQELRLFLVHQQDHGAQQEAKEADDHVKPDIVYKAVY